MNSLIKLRERYYEESKIQRQGAWEEKDFIKAKKIRQKEKITYEKWRLLDGIIKAQERERRNGKNRKKSI